MNDEDILCFELIDRLFGIPVTNAKMILSRQSTYLLPKCPNHIEGIFGYRGRAIALVKLSTLLDLDDAKDRRKRSVDELSARSIVLHTEDMTAAIEVDAVHGIIDREEIAITDPMFCSDGRLLDFVWGEFRMGDRIVILLDPVRLFKEARL